MRQLFANYCTDMDLHEKWLYNDQCLCEENSWQKFCSIGKDCWSGLMKLHGCDNRSFMRKYGYAIRGQVPSCQRLLVRGQRISGIAAIAMDGLVALELTTNTVRTFFDYIRDTLIPQMSPHFSKIHTCYGQL